MLWDSMFIGCLLTSILMLLITPIMYENEILTYGHFVMILVISGIGYFKFYEVKKQYEKI